MGREELKERGYKGEKRREEKRDEKEQFEVLTDSVSAKR